MKTRHNTRSNAPRHHGRTQTCSVFALTLALSGCPSKKPEPHFEKQAATDTSAHAPTPPSQPVGAAPSLTESPAAPSMPAPPAAPSMPAPPAAPSMPAPPAAPSMLEAPKTLVRNATSPDPLNGKFSLADATQGLPKKGALHATIETGLGKLECTLYDDKAPNTVANFVGLARGLRPWWDPRLAAWVKRPLFDLTTFHRAIPDFMIQGGDALGDGSGEVGYVIADEVGAGLRHDRAGLLCMANRGPNTNGGQFFITDAPTPHLTQMGTYTIFGECTPLDLIARIARVPKAFGDRPSQPPEITKVSITRK